MKLKKKTIFKKKNPIVMDKKKNKPRLSGLNELEVSSLIF